MKKSKRGIRHYGQEFTSFVKHVYREWRDDGTLRLGAGIAYYGTIAVFPYLVFIFVLATIFFSPHEITQTVADFVEQLFGQGAVTAAQIREINLESWGGFNAASLVGLGSFVITIMFSIVAIQDAINVIWKSRKHLRFSLSRYILAFVVVLGGAATFTAAVGIRVVVTALRETFSSNDFVVSSLFTFMTTLALVALLTGFFMLLYKLLIKIKIDLPSLFISSLITATFLMAGEYALSFYLAKFVNYSYLGAIGAYFVLLVTVYYISQIFLIGAQAGKVLSYRHGNQHLKPLLSDTDPRIGDKPKPKKT